MSVLKRALVAAGYEDVLVADGLDGAFLGVAQRCGQPAVAVYSEEECIRIMVREWGMDDDEAWEYYRFNVVGAWVGDGTPAFVERVLGVDNANLRKTTTAKREGRGDGVSSVARRRRDARVRRDTV